MLLLNILIALLAIADIIAIIYDRKDRKKYENSNFSKKDIR